MNHSTLVGLCTLAITLTTGGAAADTKTWTGGAGTLSWQDGKNWDPVGVPSAGDDVIIGTTGDLYTVVLSTSTTVNSVAVYANLTVSSNMTLTIDAESFVHGTLNLAGGLSGPGNMTVDGVINWSQLSGNTIGGGSRLTITNTGAMTKTGRGLLARTLDNYGHILTVGQTGLSVSVWPLTTSPNGTAINNYGTFEWNVTSGASLLCTSGITPCPFNNYGLLIKNGAGSATFKADSTGKVPFNNSGIVEIQEGGLGLGTGVHFGSVSIGCPTCGLQFGLYGHILHPSATVTGSGTLEIDDAGPSSEVFICNGVIDLDGNLHFERGAPVMNAPIKVRGTLSFGDSSNNPIVTFNDTVDLDSTGVVAIPLSTEPTIYFNGPLIDLAGNFSDTDTNVYFSGDVTITRQFTWGGANMHGTKLIVAPSGTFSTALPGNAVLLLPIENYGDAALGKFAMASTSGFTNYGYLELNGATQPTTILEISGIEDAVPTPTIVNYGVIRKVNAGAYSFGDSEPGTGPLFLVNHGTVDVREGRIETQQPFENTGDIHISEGAQLRLFRESTHSIDSSINNEGTLGFGDGHDSEFDVNDLLGSVQNTGRLNVHSGTVILHESIMPTVSVRVFDYGQLQVDADQNWPFGLELRSEQGNGIGGHLSGLGTVTLGGSNIFRGTMSGSGLTVLSPRASMTTVSTQSGSNPNLFRRLENYGYMYLNRRLTLDDGVLSNYGELDIEQTSTSTTLLLRGVGGRNLIDNHGTMTKRGSGPAAVNNSGARVTFVNSSMVNVNQGTMRFETGAEGDGEYVVATPATLEIDSDCDAGSIFSQGKINITPNHYLHLSDAFEQTSTGRLEVDLTALPTTPVITAGGPILVGGILDATYALVPFVAITMRLLESEEQSVSGFFTSQLLAPHGVLEYGTEFLDWTMYVPGDANGDNVINVSDLLGVINAWGPCPMPPTNCPADMNNDQIVNVSDLLITINNWG